MKICPKCGKTHDNSGKFCSRSCANSRVFSEEAKEKKRAKTLAFWSQFDQAGRKAHHHEKMKLYDFDEHQRIVQEKNRARAWSKPYEEMSHESLRKRILNERNFTCEECGIGNEYNGKPLSLELDHIDGERSNNKIENLRILCPNCHSQTPTHRAKNIKHKRLKREAETLDKKII